MASSLGTSARATFSDYVNGQHHYRAGDRDQRSDSRSGPKPVSPVLGVTEEFRPVNHRKLHNERSCGLNAPTLANEISVPLQPVGN